MISINKTISSQNITDWSRFATDIEQTTGTILRLPTLNDQKVDEIMVCEGIIRAKKRRLLEKMVLDQGISLIISLCQPSEDECFQYWPTEVNEVFNVDSINVKCLSVSQPSDNIKVYKLKVQQERYNSREGSDQIEREADVTLVHYNQWIINVEHTQKQLQEYKKMIRFLVDFYI